MFKDIVAAYVKVWTRPLESLCTSSLVHYNNNNNNNNNYNDFISIALFHVKHAQLR